MASCFSERVVSSLPETRKEATIPHTTGDCLSPLFTLQHPCAMQALKHCPILVLYAIRTKLPCHACLHVYICLVAHVVRRLLEQLSNSHTTAIYADPCPPVYMPHVLCVIKFVPRVLKIAGNCNDGNELNAQEPQGLFCSGGLIREQGGRWPLQPL